MCVSTNASTLPNTSPTSCKIETTTTLTIPSTGYKSIAVFDGNSNPTKSNTIEVEVEDEDEKPSLRRALAQVRTSLSSTIKSAFGVTLVALLLIYLYYNSPPATEVFNAISTFSSTHGIMFSMISTATFGAVLPGGPTLYHSIFTVSEVDHCRNTLIQRKKSYAITGRRYDYASYAFLIMFWCYKGCEVDLLYRLQNHLWGTGNSFRTVVLKVICDQFIYGPFWDSWTTTFLFRYRDLGFSSTQFINEIKREWFWKYSYDRWLPQLIAIWFIFIPAASVVYSFPPQLQIVLFNIILVFYSIAMNIIAKAGDVEGDIKMFSLVANDADEENGDIIVVINDEGEMVAVEAVDVV